MKKIMLISLLSVASLNIFAQAVIPATTTNPACKTFHDMPAGAVRVWPKSAYIPLQDPSCPPCYEYTGRLGRTVMECPYLWFAPETDKTNTGVSVIQNDNGAPLQIESRSTFTGNYPVCKKDPHMPANAVPVWPKSAYTAVGNPEECAPCYSYTTKRGLKVMECPYLQFK